MSSTKCCPGRRRGKNVQKVDLLTLTFARKISKDLVKCKLDGQKCILRQQCPRKARRSGIFQRFGETVSFPFRPRRGTRFPQIKEIETLVLAPIWIWHPTVRPLFYGLYTVALLMRLGPVSMLPIQQGESRELAGSALHDAARLWCPLLAFTAPNETLNESIRQTFNMAVHSPVCVPSRNLLDKNRLPLWISG